MCLSLVNMFYKTIYLDEKYERLKADQPTSTSILQYCIHIYTKMCLSLVNICHTIICYLDEKYERLKAENPQLKDHCFYHTTSLPYFAYLW